MDSEAITDAMRRAIELGRAARGLSRPNPPVGAVILDSDGQVVGQGHTQAAGGAHAEVMALAAAGERSRGATAVVSLEPCAHTGRTGPCTEALLRAGISTVCYAVADPNPEAAGGARVLSGAGVRVAQLDDDGAAAESLREWLFRQRTGRPQVTAKLALTLDGRIAAPDGSSQWITSQMARQHSHRVREELDAIIIGSGTALADDPALTSRIANGELTARQPARIVLGNRDLPATARVRGPGGPFSHVRSHNPADALAACVGAANVLLEGGPTVAGAFLDAGLIDRVQAYLSPTLLGAGRAAVEAAGTNTLTDRQDFAIESLEQLGPDLLLTLSAR